jgi:hypothetical protein
MLPCRPYPRATRRLAAEGDEEGGKVAVGVLPPAALREHVLSRADFKALGQELVNAFRKAHARRELDRERVVALL